MKRGNGWQMMGGFLLRFSFGILSWHDFTGKRKKEKNWGDREKCPRNKDEHPSKAFFFGFFCFFLSIWKLFFSWFCIKRWERKRDGEEPFVFWFFFVLLWLVLFLRLGAGAVVIWAKRKGKRKKGKSLCLERGKKSVQRRAKKHTQTKKQKTRTGGKICVTLCNGNCGIGGKKSAGEGKKTERKKKKACAKMWKLICSYLTKNWNLCEWKWWLLFVKFWGLKTPPAEGIYMYARGKGKRKKKQGENSWGEKARTVVVDFSVVWGLGCNSCSYWATFDLIFWGGAFWFGFSSVIGSLFICLPLP